MNRVHVLRLPGGMTGGALATSRVMTTLMWPPCSYVLLDAPSTENPRIDEDPDQQDAHQDERKRSSGRIVEVLQELQLDDVPDHRGVCSSQDRGVHVIPHRRHEREEDAREDSRDREWKDHSEEDVS